MDSNVTEWLSSTSREEMGMLFKYPVGVVLSISEEGKSFDGLSLGVESGLRQLPGEGAWDGTSTQTFQTLWVYECQGLG